MIWTPATIRLMLIYPAVKGLTIGTVVVAVLHSGLTPFQQALIIALVSASIGALGLIVAALIGARAQREMLEEQRKIGEHVEDVKRSVGANRRETDTIPPQEPNP